MKMKMVSLVFSLSISALTADFSVSTLGLQVTKEAYGNGDFVNQLSAFNSQGKPTTQIAFLVQSEGRKILKLQEDESKISSASDDQGGNLLSGKTFMGNSYDFTFPRTSKDGKALLATIRLPVLPKKGSTKIAVKGEFVVMTGEKTKMHKTPNVELKDGVKFKLGELGFTLEGLKESKFNKGFFELTLKTNQSLDHVKEITFLNSEGENLDAKSNGSSRSSGFPGSKSTYTKSFLLKEKLDKLTVTAELYADFKKEKISVSESVTIGL